MILPLILSVTRIIRAMAENGLVLTRESGQTNLFTLINYIRLTSYHLAYMSKQSYNNTWNERII